MGRSPTSAFPNRKHELSVLYSISRAIAQSFDLEEILSNALEATLESMKIGVGGIYLLEPDRKMLRLHVARGISAERSRELLSVKYGEGMSGLAVAKKEPVILDIKNYPSARLASFLRQEQIRSSASIPLLSRGEAVGAMNLSSRRPRAFRSEELEMLCAIGQQLGIAVQNARLYQELRKGATELERRVEERTADVVNANQRLSAEIVEREKAEEAVHRSEKRFRSLIENSTDAVSLIDAEGTVLYDSPAYERILGYQEKDRKGRNTFELVHPDDRARLGPLFSKLLQDAGSVVFSPVRIRHADGSWRWIEGVAKNMLADPGVQAIVVNFRDITRRYTAEAALRESEDKFKYIFDFSVIGKSITLLSGEIQVNKGFCDMLGYSSEELSQKNWRDISHPAEIEMTQKLLDSVTSGEKDSARFIKRYFRRDGSIVWADVSTSLRRDEQGKPLYFMTSVIDISERISAEEKMKTFSEELQRSNRDLEQFAYVVSHDLQEPLRMIASFTQLLEKRYKSQIDKDADDFIRYITDGTAHMQAMINDLLAYSRVQTRGRRFERIDLNEVLGQAHANLLASIEKSGGVLTHDPLPEAFADDVQIGLLFQNLISNALKFRKDAPPRIHISCAPGPDEWILSVKDNGIGIEPEYFERIFVIFQRLHTKDEYPGTGIGLAICKRIVERHGGRIWVESTPGQGSTFYFTIPRERKSP